MSPDGSNPSGGNRWGECGSALPVQGKGRLIFSGNDEESSSEMFFTEIETSEIEAGTLQL